MNDTKDFSTSVWYADVPSPNYPQLKSNLEADIVVIGGGITGITAAYLLAKAGRQVVLLEAKKIASGSTAYSTGNLYATVGERLSNIERRHGEKDMIEMVKSRLVAIDFIEEMITANQIDCDFQRVPWHLFTRNSHSENESEIQREFKAGKKAGLEAHNTTLSDFPYSDIKEITTFENQAQLNAYKYVLGLAQLINHQNCQIFENTPVIKVKDGSPCIIDTDRHTVKANHVIMATHSPKGVYQVHTEMEVYREFALAAKLKEALPPAAVYWDLIESGQYSVRPYSTHDGNYLIALGEPYRTGTLEENEQFLQQIEQYVHQHFNVDHIAYRWAAQNYKSGDGLPYIGISVLQWNTYIATGFKADGLVYGTLAAMLISDKIVGKEHQWLELYNPTRFTPIASAKQFAKETSTVVTHLVKDYLFYGNADSLKEIKNGDGKTLTIDGEKVAAYRDEEGGLHVVSSVCTHLGCVVHFNKAEKTWDCPCHGSRFTVDGDVIEGPAYNKLSKPL